MMILGANGFVMVDTVLVLGPRPILWAQVSTMN